MAATSPQIIGEAEGLRFAVSWAQPTPHGDVYAATEAHLQAWVGDTLIWGRGVGNEEEPIRWALIDLLEFLSENWPWITEEETYPLPDVRPVNPLRFAEDARKRWERALLSAERVVTEEQLAFEFEERHDLSRAFLGGIAASLVLLREGNDMWLCSRDAGSSYDLVTRKADARSTIHILESLGNSIRARLAESSEKRARDAGKDWGNRSRIPSARKAAIRLGCSTDELKSLPMQLIEKDELYLIAARMLFGRLTSDQIAAVLAMLECIPREDTSRLDDLRPIAQKVIAESQGNPTEQGYALARWLRRESELAGAAGKVFPKTILSKLGAQVSSKKIGPPSVNALAVWSDSHGPAVVLNSNAKRHKRFTLAHEICHLLVDRHRSLPKIEVFGGRVPEEPERRANAFAAELLLPQSEVDAALSGAETGDIDTIHKRLCDRFGITYELAAWQLRHSNLLSRNDYAALEKFVSRGTI